MKPLMPYLCQICMHESWTMSLMLHKLQTIFCLLKIIIQKPVAIQILSSKISSWLIRCKNQMDKLSMKASLFFVLFFLGMCYSVMQLWTYVNVSNDIKMEKKILAGAFISFIITLLKHLLACFWCNTGRTIPSISHISTSSGNKSAVLCKTLN